MGSERSFYTFQQSFSSGPFSSRKIMLVDSTDPENASFLVEVITLWNMSVGKNQLNKKLKKTIYHFHDRVAPHKKKIDRYSLQFI